MTRLSPQALSRAIAQNRVKLPPTKAQLTAERVMREGKPKRKHKYNARKTEVGGIMFDSKREAHRWLELRVMQMACKIRNLERQVKFELIPKQDGERAAHYVCDFSYQDYGGEKLIVEDAKGIRTPIFIIKRKLMLQVHGIRIREV